MTTAQKVKYDVDTIAKWFIWRSKNDEIENDSESLTLLKLMKFLYYAEGYSLAIGNGSLFSDEIEGWKHGPAIRAVWNKYHNHSRNLPFSDETDIPIIEIIDQKDQDCLEQVYQAFNVYSAWGLRELTYSESPWIGATKNGKVFNTPIDRSEIIEYFQSHYVEKD